MRFVGLALALMLSDSPTEWGPEEIGSEKLACEVGRWIAESGPCLGPDDCPGFEVWREWFGPPRPRPLEPRERVFAPDRRRPPLPLIEVCLAKD